MERIPQEWFRRAKKETDPYYKFMSIYMALNFLYNFDRMKKTSRLRGFSYLSFFFLSFLKILALMPDHMIIITCAGMPTMKISQCS